MVDEAYELLSDVKNKPSDQCAHGNGLCNPQNLLGVMKQIARHVALGILTFFVCRCFFSTEEFVFFNFFPSRIFLWLVNL